MIHNHEVDGSSPSLATSFFSPFLKKILLSAVNVFYLQKITNLLNFVMTTQPSRRKYGSRPRLSEEHRKKIQEKIKKQKETEMKAAMFLAVLSVFIQAVTVVFYFNKDLYPYVMLPAIFGLLISGMAIGLIHTDKVKKFFVGVVFTVNLAIVGFISYQFFMIEKEQQEEEIKESQMADSLTVQLEKAIQNFKNQ